MADIIFYSKGSYLWCPHCLKKLIIINYSSNDTYYSHLKSCSRLKDTRKEEFPEANLFYKINKNKEKIKNLNKERYIAKLERQQSLNKIIQLCNNSYGDNIFKRVDFLPENITHKSLSSAIKKEEEFFIENIYLFPILNSMLHLVSDDKNITIYNKCLKRGMNITEVLNYLTKLQNEIYDFNKSYNKKLFQNTLPLIYKKEPIEKRVDKFVIPYTCDVFMRNTIKINKNEGFYFSKLYEKMKRTLLKKVHSFPTEKECYEWFKCKIIKDEILDEKVKLSVCFRKKFIYGIELLLSY